MNTDSQWTKQEACFASATQVWLAVNHNTSVTSNNLVLQQGSYRQVCVKFKDFSRTSERLSYCFQGLKAYEKY